MNFISIYLCIYVSVGTTPPSSTKSFSLIASSLRKMFLFRWNLKKFDRSIVNYDRSNEGKKHKEVDNQTVAKN